MNQSTTVGRMTRVGLCALAFAAASLAFVWPQAGGGFGVGQGLARRTRGVQGRHADG